jgi:aconitate hydratase A / 2-methylisocitrate dehydratase
MPYKDSFKAKDTLAVAGKKYAYYSLANAEKNGAGDLARLPYSLKVLAENLLRNEDGKAVTADDIRAIGAWTKTRNSDTEIAYHPGRVIMPEVSGGPLLADMAAMRDAMVRLGGDPDAINPLIPIDLIVDHSVMVDNYGSADALKKNVVIEFDRNEERYIFLKWAQQAYRNVRIIPPGNGILHQINLEFLARVVWTAERSGETVAFPDCLIGMDSHTPMVNGLGVFGWGVGGIEAGSAMMGQPVSMLIPEVVGCRLTGALREGVTATDLVLTCTEALRKKGVVQKFVEYCGPGLANLALTDRATLANMSPEYGATMGFCPVDAETIRYLKLSGRSDEQVALVEAYCKAQGLWRDDANEPAYTDIVEIDLSKVEPSMAGPFRPNQRTSLAGAKQRYEECLTEQSGKDAVTAAPVDVEGENYKLGHGSVAIAAITSCTNTSNPAVLIGAGLLARKARAKGLACKPWVKTSLAPGSRVVAEYLAASGLQKDLDALGYNLVGFGCTTCMGNSGPLDAPIAKAIDDNDLVVGAVLSGNRNFEGRVHPQIRFNFLASPPLVVAYALAGTLDIDLTKDAIGTGKDGKPVYLKDIWPSNKEIQDTIAKTIKPAMFDAVYSTATTGGAEWRALNAGGGITYEWDSASHYLRQPPYFTTMDPKPERVTDIRGARPLVMCGDMTTTDHISPIGSIDRGGAAGQYLLANGVRQKDFNNFGSRRSNHEVMIRGTFANIRFRNEMAPGTEGGFTRHMPDGTQMTVFDASEAYKKEGVPLVVIGGKDYGTGSSRDWAAKGTYLLGIRAVIAEGFERIHRSNLIGMGVLPLQFKDGMTRKTLKLDGTEVFDITGIEKTLTPRQDVTCRITRKDGTAEDITLQSRIDTAVEVEYFQHGGMLHYVLRQALGKAA